MTVKDGTCYIIKKNNRRYNNLSFESYEQARSYIRKKLRADFVKIGILDSCWNHYNNPSHSIYGFSIVKTD